MIRTPDRRGASEVVGFVLAFALVTTTVGTAYVWGIDGLRDARDFERTNNAQRAMEALAGNVDDLVRRGAPSRATEIELADARIGSGDQILVTVSTSNGTLYNKTVAPIVYDAGEERIRYVNGAVIRAGNGGATMVRNPAFVDGDDRVLVPIVKTKHGDGSVAGSTTVLVRTEREAISQSSTAVTDRTNVTVNISTPNGDVWRRYFQRELDGWSCEPDGVVCTKADARVIVHYAQIEVGFE